jgi:hypothetical protein
MWFYGGSQELISSELLRGGGCAGEAIFSCGISYETCLSCDSREDLKLRPRIRIKQPPMLEDRIAVGHACHVIGDDPGTTGFP